MKYHDKSEKEWNYWQFRLAGMSADRYSRAIRLWDHLFGCHPHGFVIDGRGAHLGFRGAK